MASESSDVDSLLELTTVQAARGIGIKHTKIMRYRPEEGDFLLVAGVGWHPGVVGHTIPATDLGSAPGQALQTRQPVIVYDLPNDRQIRYPAVLKDHGIISALNVPVVVNGSVWGVLEVDSETARHFGNEDSGFLYTLANILGLGLDNRLRLQQAHDAAAEAPVVAINQQNLFEKLRHRSKNDFQLVQSLLLIQRRKLADEEARDSQSHLMDRVTAIGMAHDQLTPVQASGACRDRRLSGPPLRQPSAPRRKRCRRNGAGSRGDGARKGGVPRPDRERACDERIQVRVSGRQDWESGRHLRHSGGEGVLTIQDNGVGMGPPRAGSSGTKLIQVFVQQVGGMMETITQPAGVGFRIRFPLVN